MPATPPMPELPPLWPARSIAADAAGWLQAYLRFGCELWSQAPGVIATAAGRAAREACSDMAERGAGALISGLWRNYVDGVSQLASTMVVAAETAVAVPPVTPPRSSYEIKGRPFLLPARVIDARQGWALYFVPVEVARKHLGMAEHDFDVIDTGHGRTPVIVLGVDYRASDFGTYPELVFSLLVQPKGQPVSMPLVHYLAIVVSQDFTKEAALAVWGLEKTLVPTARAVYAPDAVRFEVAPGALSVTFPRFGEARSAPLPIHSLSFRDGVAMQAVSMRVGAGEGMQIGGSVKLALGDRSAGTCLCRDAAEKCLCDTLRGFDIEKKLPAANGWAEIMSGDFGAPSPIIRSGTSR